MAALIPTKDFNDFPHRDGVTPVNQWPMWKQIEYWRIENMRANMARQAQDRASVQS